MEEETLMVIPEGLYYAKSHEWVKFLSEDTCLCLLYTSRCV